MPSTKPNFVSLPPPEGYSPPVAVVDPPSEWYAEFQCQGHEQSVWADVISRRAELLRAHRSRIAHRYLEGFAALNLSPDSPPTLAQINECLESIGWQARYVDGYIPGHAYASLLNNKIFPI